ncbi:MAG: hypothetical protein WC880_03355 [Candidatus Paceibacterota bacterium]
MYDSSSEIIQQHKTPVDEKDEYREYVVYKKDGMFVTECIGWKIKSVTRTGGSRDYYKEFESETDAVEMYDELLANWEAKD